MRRLGRGAWAAQGEASGAATPGSGPHQQLCNKSPGLSVPGFVTTGKQDTAQHLCPETPSSCVLQARALNWWPGPQRRGGVVTWRKKTSLAPRRGRRGKMLSRTSSARTQGGAGAGVLFGSAGWLGARTGPSGPCPCSPCGGCPLPLGGSLADQRGLPGGTRAGQSLGRCSSAT